VWVASNKSLQEETARALRQVGFLGKPVIVVINGLLDLGHPLKRAQFLREPARAFRDVDGDVKAIQRQLNVAGVRPLSVVMLHADAAFESSRVGPDAEGLERASKVDTLLEVLRTEQVRRAPQRRALRLIDEVRGPACEFQAEMQLASERLEASITQARGMTRDLDRRWQREVDRHFEVLESQLRRAVDRRRDWHLSYLADPGKVEAAWKLELEALNREITELRHRAQELLTSVLKSAGASVLSEWRALPIEELELGDLAGFRSVWANRALRVGIGVGVAAAGLAGAQIGGVLGVPGGPLGIAVGVAGGFVVGGVAVRVATPLKDAVNMKIHGLEWVLAQRDEQIRTQTGNLLNDVHSRLTEALDEQGKAQRRLLQDLIGGMEEVLAVQASIQAEWQSLSTTLERHIDNSDTQTAKAILALSGREELAEALVRGSRNPGVAIAAELTGEGHWQAVMSPPDATCEVIATCGPPKGRLRAGQALPLAMGLCAGRIEVKALAPETASLVLLDDRPADGIVASWEDLLSHLTASQIAIATASPPTTEGASR